MDELLELNGLSFAFPGQPPLFSELSMSVRRGEFVSIVGASGCGKSTLFKIIAGLLQQTGGSIRLQGQTSECSRLGKAAYMPQQDLLLPWRSVQDNCLLPLEIKGKADAAAIAHVRDMLQRFGLAGSERAYPHELSGGMRQRAAFLRTLLCEGELLLLDEPFGALDAITKRDMHRWLLELWDGLGRSALFITHDLEEALLLSDRVLLMPRGSDGPLQEFAVGMPRPRSLQSNYEPGFVAMRAELERRLYESRLV
ncbi:ABC transporter ATP-binding protein [Paenibacillus sp. HN-1]|uniref:ABC transporter ATP-binding protein n=1 Tax=Paenibacillus TaxID=44249 RepID=UPI001CA96889|nr:MULTISPECIES: ABC transporter ATP-binding protein [Paenibacillus]MBY9078368.1 ABC transporter ATP-binding protein [Paenibacillus sp. CGMCC 1.18879]MBY9087299.1 ABC transporter ATP-binding protein [Paenibacillus sinensis]